ncbi:MAG: hypothetical protein ISS77_05190 [Phycisphaerae bacterium]|nr:hypothetical protein [Phycisphaerae bacterium]
MNSIQFILAMIAIIITWGLLFAIFVGVGLLVQLLMGLRKFDSDHCFMAFWMGLACTILFLQLWHLVMPVGALALATVSAFGILGLFRNKSDIFAWSRKNLAGKMGIIVALLVLAVWLANRSAGPCKTDDSGLYHLSGVRWITEYPIIPGLGNLHDRLAFNNASFLYCALLEVGPWYGKATHLANGLLLLVLGAQCILGGYRLAQPKCRKMGVSLFNLTLLTPLILTAVHSWISSYNTDLPTAMIVFAATATMFAFLLRDDSDLKSQAYDVIFVLTVLAAGVCVKVSLVFFFLTAATVIVSVWLNRAWSQRTLAIKTTLKAAMMTFLLIAPWLVRGIILSGYLIYPSTFTPITVSWRVPENIAKWHINEIRIYGRRTEQIDGWQWLGPWMKDLERNIILPIVITLLGVAVLVWLRGSARKTRIGTTATGWLLPVTALVGVAAWFFISPVPRYGFFLFWILSGTFLAMLFHRYTPVVEEKKLRNIVLIVCIVFSIVNIKKFFIMPPTNGGLHATPKVVAKIFTTASGLNLYVPAEGIGCWDMQLPCTPYPRKNLRLRRKEDLQSGFILDGAIEPPPE